MCKRTTSTSKQRLLRFGHETQTSVRDYVILPPCSGWFDVKGSRSAWSTTAITTSQETPRQLELERLLSLPTTIAMAAPAPVALPSLDYKIDLPTPIVIAIPTAADVVAADGFRRLVSTTGGKPARHHLQLCALDTCPLVADVELTIIHYGRSRSADSGAGLEAQKAAIVYEHRVVRAAAAAPGGHANGTYYKYSRLSFQLGRSI